MRVLSAVCGVAIVALLLGVGGGALAQPAKLPPLSIEFPPDHGRIQNPVSVVFDTPALLEEYMPGRDPNDVPDVCLHIGWDTTIMMPSLSDISAVDTDRYSYDLPVELSPGGHYIKVFWGNSKTHKPVGPIQVVLVDVPSGN
jgi:hypothetical protein